MQFRQRFLIHAPVEKVSEFHRSSTSLEAITPPFFFMGKLRAPARLVDGSQLSFRLWLGPLPIQWIARIEKVSPSEFSDVQLSGPFEHWVHNHHFEANSPATCFVTDQVEYRLRRHPFWLPVGLLMSLGLPLLFSYRRWKTKSMLERSKLQHGTRISL
jgi:ligand-binding SRPBCC domain-containing protein